MVQLRMIVFLRVDPSQALSLVQICGDRLGGNELAVAFDRQTELSAQRRQLRQTHAAALGFAHAEITEPEGDIGISGQDVSQKPGRRAVRREQLDDGLWLEVPDLLGFLAVGNEPPVLVLRDQVRPRVLVRSREWIV